MTERYKTDELERFWPYELEDQSLVELIARANDLLDTYKEYTNLRVTLEQGYEDVLFVLRGDRPETEKERAKRLQKATVARGSAEKKRKNKRETELKELARLQAKYPVVRNLLIDLEENPYDV